jgi:RNA polymerase-binding protein DksA
MAKVKAKKSKGLKKAVRTAAKARVKVKPSRPVAKKSSPSKNGNSAPVKISPPRHLSSEMLQVRSRLMGMLSEMRKDIETEVRGAKERDLAHIIDTSDMASDAAEGDLALRIAESETAEAGEIERAIEKVDNGTYGICEICNKAIGVDRLQFLPYVTMCIKCQELAEIRKRKEGEELEDLAEGGDDSENN